ncbi:PREDICTED: uncharacterized protein LOC106149141 isoform X2 [Chinchilla lanigera]|uniref:uncharacterized protein LOC106149141 isoform X2 n=1 Tax=Chinchilla lanigera TaxID=34839 RepID=UPI000696EE2D|nr:PREDICTED: uncharacterized protein LOC106149141 isoform X2 [Chinchilla lanigera]
MTSVPAWKQILARKIHRTFRKRSRPHCCEDPHPQTSQAGQTMWSRPPGRSEGLRGPEQGRRPGEGQPGSGLRAQALLLKDPGGDTAWGLLAWWREDFSLLPLHGPSLAHVCAVPAHQPARKHLLCAGHSAGPPLRSTDGQK